MKNQTKSLDIEPLEQTYRRFKAWRDVRAVGARIPEGLWGKAVELSREYGLHRTAKLLHLNRTALKKRVGSQKSAGTKSCINFVELVGANNPCGCLIEFENQRGAKMRVEYKGVASVDIEALVRSFSKV